MTFTVDGHGAIIDCLATGATVEIALDYEAFARVLSKHAGAAAFATDAQLFGDGLNMSSIRFAEFILELEEQLDIDIDPTHIPFSVKTVGQLFEYLKSQDSVFT